MSRTNVDSNTTYHIVNSTIVYEDERENGFESPAGGINTRGIVSKEEAIVIPLNDVARLIDDDGKTVLLEGTMQEVTAKKAEMEAKKRNAKKEDLSRD